MANNNNIVVTGHRPHKLGKNYTFDKLVSFCEKWLTLLQPSHIIDGAALGFDLSIAVAAKHLNIPYTLAIPYASHDKAWLVRDKLILTQAIEQANKVHIVSKGLPTTDKLHKRNRWMLDEGQKLSNTIVIALWNGQEQGGTFNAIRYADLLELPIINLWSDYTHEAN